MLTRTRAFSQSDIDAFVALTGDGNKIHSGTHERAVVPGLLAAALFPAIIGSRYPGALYARQELHFKSPVLVGDTVTATVKLLELRRALAWWETVLHTSDGQLAVQGSAVSRHRGAAACEVVTAGPRAARAG